MMKKDSKIPKPFRINKKIVKGKESLVDDASILASLTNDKKAVLTDKTEEIPVVQIENSVEKPELPKVKKTYGKRAFILGISGFVTLVGAIFLIFYIFNMNMIMGAAGVIFLFAGVLTFYYYWQQQKDISISYVGEVPKEQVNSMSLYPDMIKFENIYEPGGFIWHCIDDGKPYYVNILEGKKLVPYVLPDQQYYDPNVFAQRVLTLPAHRKLFTRKQDLFQKLKPFMAALIGVGLWILILTTTGGGD